ARAAASAELTRTPTCSSVVALPETDPAETPPAFRTNETTVTSTPRIAPLVVRVLLAQRRLAVVWWWAITTQSSAVDAARAGSTGSCRVAVPVVISGLPRRRC